MTELEARRRPGSRLPALIIVAALAGAPAAAREGTLAPGGGAEPAPAPAAEAPARVDEAIMRGLAFLARSEPNPHLYIFLDMFRRRYGLGVFEEARSRFDELMAMAPEDSRRFVRSIRRLIDPGFPPPGESADVCIPTVDELTCPALYCDRHPAPADYPERLSKALSSGRYGITHVALSAMVAKDLGCDGFVPAAIQEQAIEGMKRLIEIDGRATDLEFEAATFLTYLGHGEDVPAAFRAEALGSQRASGAWALDPAREASDSWHAACTAVWYLLETHPVHRPRATMVPLE